MPSIVTKSGYNRRMPAKIVLLTGCASGIGQHLARSFAARDYEVIATDIAPIDDPLLTTANNVRIARLDVRDEANWQTVVEGALNDFGRIDLLLNVAGYLLPGYVENLAAVEIDRHLDINVKGTVLGTHIVAQHMVAQRSGHIINFGSLASLAPAGGLALYVTSKFAVRGFTLAIANRLRQQGVAVTLIMPDAVATPMLDLQTGYDEASITFSGFKTLTTDDIERAVFERILTRKPLEVSLPRERGILARFSNVVPRSVALLEPVVERFGRNKRLKYKKRP